MADLAKLEEEINALGETIKNLKSSADAGGDSNKDAIATAVQNLLAAKKAYAENNNGIGVDGKPFETPLTKSQQKAKAKAEKAAAAAGAAGCGGASDAAAAEKVCVLRRNSTTRRQALFSATRFFTIPSYTHPLLPLHYFFFSFCTFSMDIVYRRTAARMAHR
jgi:hypothetical protein